MPPVEPLLPERRTRSSMVRRFGLLYHLLGFSLLLRRLRLEDHSAEHVRRAFGKGPLVYALHTRSWVDWLALNRVLNARRLPLARVTPGMRTGWVRPLGELVREAWAALRGGPGGRERAEAEDTLVAAVAAGQPACIFLVDPPRMVPAWLRWLVPARRDPRRDPVRALLEAQERADRPIQVVPVVVVWQRAPETLRSEAVRALLGSQDEPGPLQKLLAVAMRSGRAIVQAGRPLDLREFSERTEGMPFERRVRAARIVLRRYLYRESRIVRGPRVRPYRWTRRIVLESPEVRALVRREAQATGRPEAAVRAEVERILDRIAARVSFPVVELADQACRVLFRRIFAGVDIRDEDVERLREAMRAGTPVLVPCHRSHLDYLLLSWTLFRHDIVIPHVVAGENLAFWPVGPIFRRLGAVFIKRSFRGDRIFPVVFERYLRQLLRDGHPVEFFIEGGRSRSGKLLPPRLGVLGMVMDAASMGREDREISLLPVAISYEQIAEEAAYARELAGARKRRESVRDVVRARKVVRKRFGRVYVRVGEPVRCSEVFAEVGQPWREVDRDRRRDVLERVAERIMFRIAENMVVLPTGLVAMALLGSGRSGMRVPEIVERVERIERLLRRRGARPAASLSFGGWAVEEALARFERERMVRRIADEEGDIVRIEPDRRITIEYYKNGLLGFVAPASLMAACAAAAGDDRDEALRLFRVAVFLLRYEFILDPSKTHDELAEEARADVVAYGALAEAGGVADPALLEELAGLVRSLVESYAVALRALHRLRGRDVALDDLPRQVRRIGEALLAIGEVTRPEALSLENLRNAVRAFREEGLVAANGEGGGGLVVNEEARAQYAADLGRLLG